MVECAHRLAANPVLTTLRSSMVSIAAHPIRDPTARKFAVGYQQPTTVAHRVAVPRSR